MKKVYICSPYRAANATELYRNLAYARELTRQAVDAGFAPITPHLYLTQCLDDKNDEERAAGMAVGEELLTLCDVMFVGDKYGISEGMKFEIALAKERGIRATKLTPAGYRMRDAQLRL